MPIAPEGRFIPVNMDWCQDLMGRLFEHVTPVFPFTVIVCTPRQNNLPTLHYDLPA